MSSGASELTRGDSLDLLALGNLGVLIFTRNALNSTVPARYVVEPDRVLVHVTATTDNAPWRDGDVLTLCASAFDSEQQRGWSVSVTGRAHTPHLGGLDEPPTAPWIASGSGNLLEIKTDLVEGQRLGLDRNTTHNKTHRDRSALRTGSNLEDSQQ